MGIQLAVKTIRIFISSPGDVTEERDKAEAVIRGLDRHYGGRVRLVVVRWENLGLGATASFQEGIVKVLKEDGGVDIGVFILWSRLGTPLGAWALRSDGRRYRSGTEQEFDLMLEASRRSDGSRPHLLAYVREDDRAYSMALAATQPQQRLHVVEQWTLAREFITETFTDAVTGQNLRAFHLYDQPVTFADRLRIHLRNVIDRLIGEVAGAVTWDERPYRGLESFDIAHEAIFRGREEHVCDVLQQLRRNSDNGCAFAVVVGASGSGKSSLVRAGVVPSLLHNANDGAKQWRHAAFTPSLVRGAPLAGLVEALASEGALPELRQQVRDLAHLSEKLARDPESARDMALLPALSAARDAAGGPVRIIVIVDQMEELFVPGNVTEEERGMFLRAIRVLACYSLPGEGPPFRFVATLRSDFYAAAQRDEVFLKLKGEHGHYDLLAPDPAALQRIITEPARLAGVEFEEREGVPLDRRLLADAIRGADALPLLEYALDTLYENRDLTGGRARMTYEAYDAMGGVDGALGGEAERVFQSLPEEIRGVFGAVMQELVTVDASPEAPPLRQRVPLNLIADSEAKHGLVLALLKARFLTADRDARSGASVVGLAHEALLRCWDRLVLWIEANRHHLRVRARVEQAQVLWERAHAEVGRRDSSLLLPEGLPLEEARGLLQTTLPRAGTAAYIRASMDHHQAATRRRRQIRRNVVAVLSVLTVLAMAASLWAWKNQRKSERLLHEASMADYALALHRMEKDGKWHEGLAYLARALRWEPQNSLAASRLYSTLAMCGPEKQTWSRVSCRLPAGVESVKFSLDGKMVVGVDKDGAAHAWAVDTGESICGPLRHTAPVNFAHISPDGKRIATVSFDETVRIWEAATGKALGEALRHGGEIESICFSPDGDYVITKNKVTGTVQLWDGSTGKAIREPLRHDAGADSRQFSADGRHFVTIEWNRARVWAVATGFPVCEPLRHAEYFQHAQFSPDGERIVTASADNTARVWDVASGEALGEPLLNPDWVNHIEFSPDGTEILTVSGSQVKVWDANTGKLKQMVDSGESEGGVWRARFSPSGTHIVFVRENSFEILEASTGAQNRVPIHEKVQSEAFSPDGTKIYTAHFNHADETTTIRVRDIPTGKTGGDPLRSTEKLSAAQFSSDGTRIVARGDKHVVIWNSLTGKKIALPLAVGAPASNREILVSPDGKRIVTAGEKQLRMWDTSTGKILWRHDVEVHSMELSPDGSRIIVGSRDGHEWRVWELDSGKEVGEPFLHEGGTRVSPCGNFFLTSDEEKTAQIWNFGTRQRIGKPFSFDHAQFSPNGMRIFVWVDDEFRVLDTATGTVLGNPLRLEKGKKIYDVSDDGVRSLVLAEGPDGSLRVWDAVHGVTLGTLIRSRWEMTSARLSSDGMRAVIACGTEIDGKLQWVAMVKDVTTGKTLGEPLRHLKRVDGSLYSPDGTRVLTMSDEAVWLWDISPLVHTLIPVPEWMIQRAYAIAGMELSEDGELTALTEDNRCSVLFEERTGSDHWARLARWLVLPARERTLTPDSGVTVREIAERERDSGTREGLESALRYDPSVPLAHVLLAGILAREDAKKKAEKIDPAIAQQVAFLRRYGLGLLSKDAELQSRAAEILVKQKDFESALIAVEKALALEPKNLVALRARAGAFAGLERNVEALAAYRAVLEAGGVDEGDFSDPAYLAAKMQRQSDAKFFLAAGRAKLPGSVSFARIEGWSLINLGDEAGAVAAFRRGESLVGAGEKRDEDLLAGLSLSLWLNQQMDEAVAAYIRLIESREDRAWATREKIAGTGWPEAEHVPLESLRIETLRRHPEWMPKQEDGVK